ncbi:hypothetical protein M8J76_012161 [Diaphorina citri]|nr:hypothetical protein M8J76_012161 [Diaphorina citri]
MDGIFTLSSLISIFHEAEVKAVLSAHHEKQISVEIHAGGEGEGEWSLAKLDKEYFSKLCRVSINPSASHIAADSAAVGGFLNYLSDLVIVQTVEDILPPTQIVGNIRFTHPTLYVFPGGHGDAALFGINGFNMLIDGGFGRKACFWDFIRHLDRVDAMLMTRINKTNVCSLANVVRRKKQSNIHPQVGHFFCNLQDRKHLASPDTDKDSLLIDVLMEGQEMISNLKAINLKPQPCYRDANMEPINLYHKVGYGKLDMYVISPARDSREVKEFLMKWHSNDTKLFSAFNKKTTFPIQNLVSICALLVWQPANPNETITRLLFPGSAPQYKIFEGLEKIKHLEFLKYPVCTSKSLNTTVVSNRSSSKTRTMTKSDKPGDDLVTKTNKLIEDLTKENILKPEITKEICNEENESKKEEKEKPRKTVKKEVKARVDSKITKKKTADVKDAKEKDSDKSSPTTPKKSIDTKMNGIIKASRMRNKSSPSSTPSKSAKEEVNKKVAESKKTTAARSTSTTRAKSTSRPKEEAKAPSGPKKVVRRPVDGKKDDKKSNMKLENIKNENIVTTDSSTVSTPSTADNAQELKEHVVSKVTKEVYKITTSIPDKGQDTEEDEIMTIEKVEGETEPSDEVEEAKEEGEVKEEVEECKEEVEAKDEAEEEKDEAEEAKEEEEGAKEKEEAKEEEGDIKDGEEKVEEQNQDVEIKPALNLDLNFTQAAQDKDETAEAKDDLKDDADVVKESTPKKKDKTSGSELSSEDIGKGAQKDSDDKKDEKIISTIESGQTTTAPTLPEDERIPLDEIKEEKVNVDAIPGKKIDIKREAHISKIQTGIVKTPDEVADLPVHEEVDATDYEDIEKKDEGIEEMEEEEVLEEQEGSADIMKGSISVITTTRESDDILNDGDDGEKITEKTEDEVKITDEKGSEDSKEVLDKLSKEKINEEKLKSEKSAEEVKGKEMKEEKVVSDEKLEKDMINIAKIEGTVTSKEESNIADEVKEKLEEVKKSEELVEAKNTAVVEEPIYGNLKPDHAEYVTVTPDSTDSPKKTDVSGTEDNKTADKDHTKDDLEATKETSKEEGKIAEEKSETCIKQETNELLAEKSTVSPKDEIESVTTADTTSGTNDEVPTALSAPTNDTDEKSQGKDQKITENKTKENTGSPKEKTDGQENLQEGKVIESTAEDIDDKKESKESAVSKSPVGSSIPSPTKGDSKEVIDENVITKSSTADTDGVQEKRDSIADQKNDTVTLSEESKPLDGEKSISADKADTTIEDKDGVEQKSTDKRDSVVAPGDEKSNDKTENIKEEEDADKTKKEPLDPKSSKPEISKSEEKVDLDPTRYGSEGKPESEAKDTAKELHEDNKVDAKQDGKPDEDNKGDAKQDKKTESSTKLAEDKIEDHGTPPKSPSDILDSRKTSTESLGKSTTESILSADQPEELDKEVTVSQDRKLSKDELIIAEVSKSEVKSDVESTLPKENLEKISTDNGPSESKITSSETTTKTSEPVDSSKASPVKATEDKVYSDIESKKESEPSEDPKSTESKFEEPPVLEKVDKMATQEVPTKSPTKKSLETDKLETPPKSPKGTDSSSPAKSPDAGKGPSPPKSPTQKTEEKDDIPPPLESTAEKSTKDDKQSSPPKTPKDSSGKSSPSKSGKSSPLKESTQVDKVLSEVEKQSSKEIEDSKTHSEITADKEKPTPPKSPTEKSTTQEKLASPPKSPQKSTPTEKSITPPKTPTEKLSADILPSPPKSPVEKSKGESLPSPSKSPEEKSKEKAATPPKSPTEKLQETDKLPSPSKLPAEISKEKDEKEISSTSSLPNEKTPPKSPTAKSDVSPQPEVAHDEKPVTPPKSPTGKSLSNILPQPTETEKPSQPIVPPQDQKPSTPSQSPTKKSKENLDIFSDKEKVVEKIATPPKSPTEKVSTENLSSPSKSVAESKESEDLAAPTKTETLKGTEKLPSPPKSPVEKSKEDAKPSTPPKSPTVKTEEKLGSPPKTPTEKSSGVEKLSSPPKSPTIKSKEEQPPKSPTEKSKDVTSSPKTQTEKSSPPKSPVDKSKDTEPPNSPANKSEEKTVTPPKSPVEKSTTEAVSPQKSSTDKASEGEHSSPRKSLVDETEGKEPSPSKTPAEKPSETEMVSSPLKSPADKSKELEKHETPPKSPVKEPKEKLATPPKTPTEKSSEVSLEKSKDIEKLQTSAGSTEKSEAKDTFSTSPKTAPHATKEAEKLKTPPKSPEATSTKDKLVTPPNTPVEKSLKVDTPPKTPTDKSIEVDKLGSPPKSPKEKSKEAESPTKSSKDTILPSSSARNIETSITNGAEKIIDGEVHSKVDSTPKSSTEPKESETKHSTPEVQDTGKQNGSVASSANIGEHKVTDSEGEKTKLEKKEEDSSGKISNVFTSITNGISSSVAEVIQSVEDISTKIIEDVEHVTGLELDISKTKESNDLPTEKTDRDTNGGVSTSKDNFNTKTDQKTEVENKAVDKSSTKESQSTSDNVELEHHKTDIAKENLQIDNRKDSKSSPTISINGSPEKKEHSLVLREQSLEKTLSSTSSVKDEDSRKTTPALSPSISINGSPVKDIDKLTKEFSIELKLKDELETVEIKPLMNGDVLLNGVKAEVDGSKEASSQLKDVIASEKSPSSSGKASTPDGKEPKIDATVVVSKKSDEVPSSHTVTVTATIESPPGQMDKSIPSDGTDTKETSSSASSEQTKQTSPKATGASSSDKTEEKVKSDDSKNGNSEVETKELDSTAKEVFQKVTQERSETPDAELIRSRMMPMRTSYIGAGDSSSRSETPDSRLDDIEDDTPYSPVSVTSSFSPPPEMILGHDQTVDNVLDNMTTSVINPDMSASVMMSSFYGTLPGSEDNEGNIAFERALDEHRSVRGNDLLTDNATSVTSINTVPKDTNGNANIRQNLNEQESAFIGQSLATTQSTVSNDPIKDWGKPLGLPPPPSPKNKRILVWNPVEEWGRPLGLPSPVPLVDNTDDTCADNINVELTPINDKLTPRKTGKKDISGKPKRPDSPGKYKLKELAKRPPTGAVYVDLAYIPHHGHTSYTNAEFFKKIRARHYVFSGIEPSKNVFNALLEAKQTWEDKDLGYWVTENEETLTKYKIDLSPSASRCTINLQDHETSCSAYRLEF